MTSLDTSQHGQLFIRFREEGDLRAFETVMDIYHKPIFNYLMRMLHRREEAEDALQEVWLKVIRQKESYKEQGNFSSWLYRIAHNYCVDHYRKQSTRLASEEVVETVEGDAILSLLPADGPSPFDALEAQIDDERLEEAVAKLPDALREVFLLRAVHETPFKEIAEIQGAPLGTVLSRMHQAVNSLRRMLKPTAPAITEEIA